MTQISLSSNDWEIVKEDNATWVSDVYLTPRTYEIVNKKYTGRKHLFDGHFKNFICSLFMIPHRFDIIKISKEITTNIFNILLS